MNICFISNFEKTLVCHAVAQQLIARYGLDVYWVVVNKKYFDFLLEHYPSSKILYVHKALPPVTDDCVGEFKLNEIIYNDRFFAKNVEEGTVFLKTIQRPLYNFIKSNEIRFVFGEATWSHELLMSRILKSRPELRCRFFKPNVVRLPNDRFAFYPGEEEILFPDPSIAYSELDHPVIKLQQQEYTKAFDEQIRQSYSLTVKLARAKRFFTKENIEKNDPSLPYKFNQRLVRGTKQELFRSTYKLLKKISLQDVKDQHYVVYPLHVQPEASIDVMGRYYNDQLLNITNIWKLLPNNWKLVVKEHSNGIGDRSLNFYKRVAQLPGICIIDEKTNSHELIAGAQAIFTVSGTVGYEAALMQITAFTFANMFFNLLEYSHKISLDDFGTVPNLEELIRTKNANNLGKMNIRTFSNFIYHHTYVGTWEPVDKKVMTEANINSLAGAVSDFIKRQPTLQEA